MTMNAEWRKMVKESSAIPVFEALEHERYLWRSMRALEEASGLSEEKIRKILEKYTTLVREARSPSGESIWALQERYFAEKPLGIKILDFMSHQSTSTSS